MTIQIPDPPVKAKILDVTGLTPVWHRWFMTISASMKQTAQQFADIAAQLQTTSVTLTQVSANLAAAQATLTQVSADLAAAQLELADKVDNATFTNHTHSYPDLTAKPLSVSVTVVTGVNFVAQTVATETITYLQGVVP